MIHFRQASKALGYAAASALALAALSGCAGSNKFANAANDGKSSVSKTQRELSRAIAAAEKAVRANPSDPALRQVMGRAYLNAGRFESASTSFDDAMKLGEGGGQTALSLALAEIGAGRNAEAIAVLDDWRDAIPASDLGLALALAGESGRGVAVLADALRGGDNTPKVRQNLALAYAIDGSWSEARLMVAQDVPANLVDQRISDWAMMMKPEDGQKRVASLLSGGLIAQDPGQPQELALNISPASEQRAVEALASAPAAPAPAAPALADAELPAIDGAPARPAAPMVAIAAPAPVPVAEAAEADNFTAPATPAAASTFAAAAFSAAFADQGLAPMPALRAAPVRRAAPAAKPAPRVAERPVVSGGTHLVQLGSFLSEQGARRAWGVYTAKNPDLRNYRMTITPAVVHGRNFWRVAAAGLDAGSARGLCSSWKNRGGACFAYASVNAPATGRPIPRWAGGGAQKARR